ncbi:AAA family ATPase, partial [Actinomadura bangladeshensis]|nr:AAA family ATPase [Actinomadura bangladeshensis]
MLSPSPGTSGPLLERRDELAVLESLLEDAAAGSGGAVVVTSAAGTGKTALLTAARNAAGAHGLLPLHARGRELERDVGFGIATALLGPLVRERGGPPSGLAMLTSTLFGQGDGAGPAPSGDELVIGLYWLVDSLCRDQGGGPAPLLLAVDDLHWTDTGSLRFLEHLTDRLDELPVAVVAAGRPERRLSGLMAQRNARSIAPAPLSPAAVDALARRSFPDAEPGFVRACARVTGGNPFLMVELLRSVRDAGIAPTEGAAAALIPDTVLRSTVARLAGLPAPARRLAEAVAVLGDDAPLPRA